MKLLLSLLSGSLLLIMHDHSLDIPTETAGKLREPHYISQKDITSFIHSYPKYKDLSDGLKALYGKDSSFIWFSNNRLKDFARVVYNNAMQMDKEGLPVSFPYAERYATLFYESETEKAMPETELLISSLYLYYNKRVYDGLDPEKSTLTGWHLPRGKTGYTIYLETLLDEKNAPRLFNQYYNLKKALNKYKEIEAGGGWDVIAINKNMKPMKLKDTAATIAGVRTRLFREGYLQKDSGQPVFDEELLEGISDYKARQNKATDSLITLDLINELNVGVEERIRCIMVNMERCRWIPVEMNDANEFIAVNIPSYRLHYFRDGKPFLISKVVVGKEATKTVVFSGEMSYIVFSPYWNVPNSILQKEILPEMKKDKGYMARHNMERNGNKVRQRPGPSNPLGPVKFIFPNSNNIYLHDTPSKSLFNKNERAFSHGCIRVEKARELALAIMSKDAGWAESKVDQAMNEGKESTYVLRQKIPVFIAYFTAWADDNGNTAFYDDIYERDDKLAELLYKNE
jgi:L,D-transpeptidase YcbB